eukprot:540881-Pyramimonas_sp.AAC.1
MLSTQQVLKEQKKELVEEEKALKKEEKAGEKVTTFREHSGNIQGTFREHKEGEKAGECDARPDITRRRPKDATATAHLIGPS